MFVIFGGVATGAFGVGFVPFGGVTKVQLLFTQLNPDGQLLLHVPPQPLLPPHLFVQFGVHAGEFVGVT